MQGNQDLGPKPLTRRGFLGALLAVGVGAGVIEGVRKIEESEQEQVSAVAEYLGITKLQLQNMKDAWNSFPVTKKDYESLASLTASDIAVMKEAYLHNDLKQNGTLVSHETSSHDILYSLVNNDPEAFIQSRIQELSAKFAEQEKLSMEVISAMDKLQTEGKWEMFRTLKDFLSSEA